MNPLLQLEGIRSVLIRQEETIIFAFVERAQFKHNPVIYLPGGISLPGFSGSFVDYLLRGTETLHATVRRYTSPDEHPFFSDLPEPILPVLESDAPIRKTSININSRIKTVYETAIIPSMCGNGDDQQYGSSAVCDVACLQALSKRIHYGTFVAEVKFSEHPEDYRALIARRDRDALLRKITNAEVEARLLRRVERKATTCGQEIDDGSGREAAGTTCKIQPELVAEIYRRWIIPLTKEVEVDYLLARA